MTLFRSQKKGEAGSPIRASLDHNILFHLCKVQSPGARNSSEGVNSWDEKSISLLTLVIGSLSLNISHLGRGSSEISSGRKKGVHIY